MHNTEVDVDDDDCSVGEPHERTPADERFLRLDVVDRLTWLDCRREVLSASCREDFTCEVTERARYVTVRDHAAWLVAHGCSQDTLAKRRRQTLGR
jgi:hypothetical protein